MSYAEYLRGLLHPLGVYDLYAPINGASLEAKGAVLDEVHAYLEEIERETDLLRAESWGLADWTNLFSLRPVSEQTEDLRRSVQALLRIGTGACTLKTVQDTLSGCGIPTMVEELATGRVRVSFPGTVGRPDGLVQLQANIEAILPAHVGVEYLFHFLTWKLIETRKWTFQDVADMTWDAFEKAV